MTEPEWLSCADPRPMLVFLRGKVSDRKLRLFAVACCRHIAHLLVDAQSRACVEVAERFADGTARLEEMKAVHRQAEEELADVWHGPCTAWYEAWAAAAAQYACFVDDPDEPGEAPWYETEQAAEQAAQAVADQKLYIGPPYGTPLAEKPDAEELKHQAGLLREIVGDPFRLVAFDPAWRSSTVKHLAEAIYDEKAFERLPILGDALEDAGCTSEDLLNHCRQPGNHVRGCWCLDLILGKK